MNIIVSATPIAPGEANAMHVFRKLPVGFLRNVSVDSMVAIFTSVPNVSTSVCMLAVGIGVDLLVDIIDTS